VTTQPKIICLMGPTASGKTALAMSLLEHLPCEIISVDSAMIYRGMDIGTAKPTAEELQAAPHHLIDILSPEKSYSVAQFRQDALHHIDDIIARQRIPLLVGGTMMYFKALIEGLSPLPEADEGIRKDILIQAQEQGWERLHEELERIDPESAQRIHPHDPQRLTRAIEVFRLSGETLTQLTAQKPEALPYSCLQFALFPNQRSILHDHIALRFHEMLNEGFIDEVHDLMQNPNLHLDLPSMRCVGYRQCWQYLQGEFDYDEMVAKSLAATRQLAKRQLTWLRSWNNLHELDMGSEQNLKRILEQF